MKVVEQQRPLRQTTYGLLKAYHIQESRLRLCLRQHQLYGTGVRWRLAISRTLVAQPPLEPLILEAGGQSIRVMVGHTWIGSSAPKKSHCEADGFHTETLLHIKMERVESDGYQVIT